MVSQAETTALIDASKKGDETSRSRLQEVLLPELRARAAAALAKEPIGHTLQPTALVNEIYLRLVDQREVNWQRRTHFFGLCAELMRRILVDHARGKKALKRGGGWQRVPWTDRVGEEDAKYVSLLDLDEALKALAEEDARSARVVELRYFGHLTDSAIADELGISIRTVGNDWRFARSWLSQRLEIVES